MTDAPVDDPFHNIAQALLRQHGVELFVHVPMGRLLADEAADFFCQYRVGDMRLRFTYRVDEILLASREHHRHGIEKLRAIGVPVQPVAIKALRQVDLESANGKWNVHGGLVCRGNVK